MDLPQQWPEPVVPVQSLSDGGITAIPDNYVKPLEQRPAPGLNGAFLSVPVVDMARLDGGELGQACREWGFFQLVNHGVSLELVERMRGAWREFFLEVPVEEKKKLANDPVSYEGYGSRLGVEKGVPLDWSDYFYLQTVPEGSRKREKWLAVPDSCREALEEYNREIVNLCGRLMKALSISLGLHEGFLEEKFGEVQAGVRVNFYPKCPQPELTLGLSSHSDPGGLTVLLADHHVSGLQVRKGNQWVTVLPKPNAFIVNIADQIQIISNGVYKSVEHRVVANAGKERLSVALFFSPNSDVPIEPAPELVTADNPARYRRTTFSEYRLYIRKKGPSGKSQVESMEGAVHGQS